MAKKKTVKKTKKVATKKVVTKKAPAKKTTKKPVKRTLTKRTVTKKAATKKTVIKKAVTTKRTTAKKLTTKKPAVTKKPLRTDILKVVSNITEELTLTKYETGAHTTYPSNYKDPIITEEPPLAYDMDRVVLLPVDPTFAFSYWEVRDDTLNNFRERFGYNSKLALRIYDVTNVEFNGLNANEWWDVEIHGRVGTWYIKHYRGDRNLIVDVGMLDAGGTYHVICRSRAIYFPRDKVVAPGKILWMLVDEFGNKIISDIEDYTDDDLLLLRRILGEDRFKRFMKGGLDIFLGGSAWGRLPLIDNFIDLGKIPSSKSGSKFLPSSLEARP